MVDLKNKTVVDRMSNNSIYVFIPFSSQETLTIVVGNLGRIGGMFIILEYED